MAVHEHREGGWGISVGAVLLSLGVLENARGRPRRAEAHLDRARAIRENILGADSPAVAESLGPWAEAVAELGRFETAEEAYLRAWGTFEKCFGPESPALLRTINNLAELYFRRSADEEAERLLRQAVTLAEKTHGPESPASTRALQNLLVAFEAQDRWDEAEAVRAKLTPTRARGRAAGHERTTRT